MDIITLVWPLLTPGAPHDPKMTEGNLGSLCVIFGHLMMIVKSQLVVARLKSGLKNTHTSVLTNHPPLPTPLERANESEQVHTVSE